VCFSALEYVAVGAITGLACDHKRPVCCSVLQCVAACCSVLQCVAVCCSDSMLQCVIVRCSGRTYRGSYVLTKSLWV